MTRPSKPRSTPMIPAPVPRFVGRCCARCKTPYWCGNGYCDCHADERENGPRIPRTFAQLLAMGSELDTAYKAAIEGGRR